MNEFRNVKGNLQIFSEFGLNPLVVGKRRIKTCTRNWKNKHLMILLLVKIITVPFIKKQMSRKRRNQKILNIYKEELINLKWKMNS